MIGWEKRDVNDTGVHTIEAGDIVYAYHYMATLRPTPDIGEVIQILSGAAVEHVLLQEENARNMLKVGDLQVSTVGELRLNGDFQII